MIKIKNNTRGYFSLTLADSTGIKPDRTFYMETPEKEVVIPDDYSESIFTDGHAIAAYKKGYYTIIKGEEQLFKTAEKQEVVEPNVLHEIKQKVVPNAMLLAALKEGTVEQVKDYANSDNLERLVTLASENLQSISAEKIQVINEVANIQLGIDVE